MMTCRRFCSRFCSGPGEIVLVIVLLPSRLASMDGTRVEPPNDDMEADIAMGGG